ELNMSFVSADMVVYSELKCQFPSIHIPHSHFQIVDINIQHLISQDATPRPVGIPERAITVTQTKLISFSESR
ncbi:hypothetical protein A2U01_0061168, partial [Trifolium medium]|nr:hypothetical protein [Trifolium medium]